MSEILDELRTKCAGASEPSERIALLHQIWDRLDDLGRNGEALEAASEAYELARSSDSAPAVALSLRYMGITANYMARYDDARRWLRHARRVYRRLGLESDVAYCSFALCNCSYSAGDVEAAYTLALECLAEFRRLGDRRWISKTLANVAALEWTLKRPVESLDRLAESAAVLLADGHDCDAAMVMCNQAVLESELGRHAEALRLIDAALEIFRTHARADFEGFALHQIGAIHAMLGDSARAVAALEKACELALMSEDPGGKIRAFQLLGSQCLSDGDLARSLDCFARALDVARYASDYDEIFSLLVSVGLARFDLGDVEGARESALEAEALVADLAYGNLPVLLLSLRCRILRSDGDRVGAVAALEEALASIVGVPNLETQIAMHTELSELYEELGDDRAALDHFRKASGAREQLAGAARQREVDAELMRQALVRAELDRAALVEQADLLRTEVGRNHADMASMALNLVRKNEVLASVKSEVSRVVGEVIGEARPALRQIVGSVQRSIESQEDWRTFTQKLTDLHPGFIDTLTARYPQLGAAEVRVCALLQMELSTKQMADILAVSTRAIEKHRLNLRRKLGVPRGQTLGVFLREMMA